MGVSSDPEYADVEDGIGTFLTPNVITYLAQWKAFFGEAYSARDFASAKVSERDDRRNRINRAEITIGRTEIEGFPKEYDAWEESKWHAPKPSRRIRTEPGLPVAGEGTKPNGCWAHGKWRA